MTSASTIFENINIGAGIVLNCILLFAIRRFTKKSLGTYKQLLTIFAAFDVFLTIMHAFVKPKVVIVGITTFGVISDFENRLLVVVYCSCFTVPFALMIIHFLYRYWSIRHPERVVLFKNKQFIFVISLYPALAFVAWFILANYYTTGRYDEIGKTILREETIRRFGHEIREGWLIMNHWENNTFTVRPFLTLMGGDVIMAASFSIASTLCALTFYHIKRANTISMKSRKVQLKLFIAVCAQTAVPVVFVYIPYVCCLNLPFFQLPILFLDDACMMLTSCFPGWDAVVMIVLMKDFRIGLLEMVIKKKVNQAETVWMTSISNIPSNMPSISSVTTI